MKKNNEMVYWLIFVVFLMCISAYIIFYFRGGRKLKVETEIESTNDNNVSIQL